MDASPTPEVAEGFGAVADAFHRNFADPGEHAAAVSVFHHGRKVVDLWAGTDVVYDRPMPADALMMVASCSKGITATVLAMLVERGDLDPDERVAERWPEFAAAGKQHVTIGMVASHTAGLPYPPLGTGLRGLDLHRGPAVTAALAGAAPLWEPGTAMAYHPVTYGTLLDEIVRRATGRSIARHVHELIAQPLGVEMWMGLPDELIPRVVPGRWERTSPMEPEDDRHYEPGSYAALRQAFLEENPPMDPDFSDPEDVRRQYAAERPAMGAITDARSLAAMYAALLGPVHGVRLVRDDTLDRVTRPRTDDVDHADRERHGRPRHPLRARLPARLAEHAGLRPEQLRAHRRRWPARHRRPRPRDRVRLRLQPDARHRPDRRPAMADR